MTGMEPELIAILFAVAIVAGCFDAIAGGGGMLTVPALLLAGLDPVAAIATNKLQGTAGTLSSTYAFARKGLIEWQAAMPLIVIAAAGSVAGALSVSLLSRPVLGALVPVLLIVIAAYFAVGVKLSDADARARWSPLAFNLLLVPFVGFYDGVFGPGAGSFYMVGFVSLLGFNVLRATAWTKLANASSNLGSLCLFAVTGSIVWPIGLAMAAGAVLGSQIGSRLAMRFGGRLIRPLLVVISCLMAIRLLAEPDNALTRAVVRLFSA